MSELQLGLGRRECVRVCVCEGVFACAWVYQFACPETVQENSPPLFQDLLFVDFFIMVNVTGVR